MPTHGSHDATCAVHVLAGVNVDGSDDGFDRSCLCLDPMVCALRLVAIDVRSQEEYVEDTGEVHVADNVLDWSGNRDCSSVSALLCNIHFYLLHVVLVLTCVIKTIVLRMASPSMAGTLLPSPTVPKEPGALSAFHKMSLSMKV